MRSPIQVTNNFRFAWYFFFLTFLCPLLGQSQMPTTSVNVRKYSAQCKIQVLKNIGWTVNSDANENSVSKLSDKCEAGAMAELSSQLKLNLNLSGSDERSIQNTLEKAFLSSATNCAFQTKLNAAAIKATRALKYNRLYVFTPFWINDDIRLGTMKKEWTRVQCANNGRCFTPLAGKTGKAIQALYGSIFSTDCGVGLELAEYATIKELFGLENFNRHFTNDEIIAGDIQSLPGSKSFTRGNSSKRILPANGLAYAGAGYQSFIGVSGYVGSVFDKSFLDNETNVNENFMIVGSSKAAAETFYKNGGLTYYDDYLRKIWELSHQSSMEELRALENIAYFDRLGTATDITVQNEIPVDAAIGVGPVTIEILNLLKDPFLNETQIYVHPFGPHSISWHIARLAQLNPRTPYNVRFYPDVMHYGVYDRWIQSQLDDCESAKP